MVITGERLTTIRRRLETELADATREISEIDEQVRSFGEDQQLAEGVDNHIGDDSDAVFEQERLLTIREQLSDRRGQIQSALDRMDTGTYGICTNCGRPIAVERLDALPFVTLCIDCQEERDRIEERRR